MKPPLDPATIQIAQTLDSLGASLAALLGYVASLPGAEQVDLKTAKTIARQVAPTRLMPPGYGIPIQVRAEMAVERIHSTAAQLAAVRDWVERVSRPNAIE